MLRSFFSQGAGGRRRYLLCLLLLYLPGHAANAQLLSLQQAERLATQSDPSVERYRARARALREQAVADASLPDPRLRLGASNLPVDTFRVDQEPMTQLKLGVQQAFPAGDTLAIRADQSKMLSQADQALAEDARRKILRDVRITYLNLYYEIQAHQIILETKSLFTDLVKITESVYASGRASQQDVVLANLERARLDDRITRIAAREEGYRATLAQWIGDPAWGSITLAFPALPAFSPDIDLNQAIVSHPLIRAATARVEASRKKTEIAKQRYKPGFSAVLDYGFRSGQNPDNSDRPDFVTAMITMDVPLFTENRQDKTVAASVEETSAAQYARDDALRKLKKNYDKNFYLWKRLGERAELYQQQLLTSAHNNTETALTAYQSGVSEFNTLMRAEITELDVRLEALRVRVDRAIAQSRLLYITGETDNEK